MAQARVEMEATILPNGKVLVDGGSAKDEDATTASMKAEIYDPATNSFSSAGSNAFPRLYHNVQLLLPDGDGCSYRRQPGAGRVRKPHRNLPAVVSLQLGRQPCDQAHASAPARPASITYGRSFNVPTPDAANIASVVLMKAGSVTHSFDMDQRYVGLSFTAGQTAGKPHRNGPPDSNIAPPGYYMLFLVNKAGTPSLAGWVQVSGSAAPVANVQLHPERVPTPRYIIQSRHVTESALPMRKEMHMH